MSPSYKLGYAAGTALLFVIAVLLIALAPVALFWVFLGVMVWWLIRRHAHAR
jgi:hypothetical protein